MSVPKGEEGSGKCVSAKRSQFLEVLVVFEPVDRQWLTMRTGTICHLASFCQNWLRSGVRAGCGGQLGWNSGGYGPLLPQRMLVDGDVLAGGGGPVEVLGHSLLPQPGDVVGSVEPGGDGPADAPVEGEAVGFHKFEAGAGAGRLAVVGDGVVEAAGGADDGEGAVLHRVDLIEAAGFVERRHEKEVAAGFDAVTEVVGVADVRADAAGMGSGQPVDEVFRVGVAVAEYDALHEHIVEGGRERFAEEVEAFLVGEAADDAEDGQVGADFEIEAATAVKKKTVGSYGPKVKLEAGVQIWDRTMPFDLGPLNAMLSTSGVALPNFRDQVTWSFGATIAQPLGALWTIHEGYALTNTQYTEIVRAFVGEMRAPGRRPMVGVIGTALGEGHAVSSALSSLAQQPDAAGVVPQHQHHQETHVEPCKGQKHDEHV